MCVCVREKDRQTDRQKIKHSVYSTDLYFYVIFGRLSEHRAKKYEAFVHPALPFSYLREQRVRPSLLTNFLHICCQPWWAELQHVRASV